MVRSSSWSTSLHAAVAVFRVQRLDLGAQLGVMARLHADVHVAGHVVAVDGVPRDQLTLQLHALERDVPHEARVGFADEFLEFFLAAGVTEDGLAAAAPGAAEPQVLRFEQRHAEAAFDEMQRRGEAGDSATDDAHVRARLAAQRRVRWRRRCRREVVVRLAGAVHPGSESYSGPR